LRTPSRPETCLDRDLGEFARGVEDPGARSKILEIDVRNGTKRRGIRASRAGIAPVKIKWRLSLAR